MTLAEKSTFFTDFYLNVKNACTQEETEEFAKLKSDLERVIFVTNLNALRSNDLKISREFAGKNEKLATDLKNMGNDAFKNKKWIEALMLYSKGYISMPGENLFVLSSFARTRKIKPDFRDWSHLKPGFFNSLLILDREISILLANRSAALFHLENYDQALEDINRSISMGYPKNLSYKLYERQAQCYLAKKELLKAKESFKQTIHALDESKLPLEKRSKAEKDALVMVKMLEKEVAAPQTGAIKKPSEEKKSFLNESITIDYNENEGRFAKATKDISVGEQLVVEKPNVSVLLEKFRKTHCQNCFSRTTVPIACPKCADIVFCSEKCWKQASESYHKFECGFLPIIWRSGASVNCQMAMRIISTKSIEYFNGMKGSFDKELSTEEAKKLSHDDYRRISNLVRHENKRSVSSFFQNALMAHFLTSCLELSEYFGSSANSEDINFIKSLILRNLQFLQFNSHEIFELHCSKSGEAQKTVFVGAGLYPTLALFNHSCDPGIVKYYQGTTVHVNAIKPIKTGAVVAENYGPLYTQEKKEERQDKLRDLYNFDCNCVACVENWPRFEEMNNTIIRFRCDGEDKCDNVIEISADCNDFMIKCVACGQFTNILKGLKVMQDTEMINKTAKRLYDAGDINKALEKYIDLLKIMFEVLAPPFTDFAQCQQNIKDCFLHFGNSYVLSE